jgi:hypothetical protein
MTADRLDLPPEEGRFLRATLIMLILVLASGLLFGAISGAREREDEIQEVHDRVLRLQSQIVSEHVNRLTRQGEQEASPADVSEDEPQPDPS